ncbi:hypothetical protein [Laceyella putida]|uniref:hypothetical protein n=1 Tax=Laceyella putida TaxID=110101 RepID=UPI0036D4182C
MIIDQGFAVGAWDGSASVWVASAVTDGRFRAYIEEIQKSWSWTEINLKPVGSVGGDRYQQPLL